MRLLALTRFASQGASSRLRTLQYLPHWRSAGISVDVAPFFGADYLNALYYGGPRTQTVLRSYLRRIADLRKVKRYDVVWVEKEILPWVPYALESALIGTKTHLVADYDDAIFHRYDQHRLPLVRFSLGKKIDRLMARASLVTAGNDYLEQRARQAGCTKVERLPTVVDLERYPKKVDAAAENGQFTIGWIGSPATAHFLQIVAPALRDLVERYRIRCVAIGARRDQVAGTPFEALDWSEREEVAMLHELDVGIMPLHDAPFERGKCAYKLIQYMACGLPVVASPVGANVEVVSRDVGFLAASSSDWQHAIETLYSDPSMRKKMGLAGRQKVEAEYCVQVQAPRLIAMLRQLVNA